ncbi:hypothetical protein QBC42DRAFT_272054 [Cladorrhinum samala]|uniref:Uncharacterized protein n=1 Tax=Cladorrhinum samala TaxID=585594 RepID=A0AAV9HKR4_9PEZI|nr:hypothetical protein QBC42DRAFT_272054 [Cladorrhinum samala]
MKPTLATVDVTTITEKPALSGDRGLVPKLAGPFRMITSRRTKDSGESNPKPERQTKAIAKTISAFNLAAYLGLGRRSSIANLLPSSCPLRYMDAASRKAREAQRRSEAIDLQIRRDSRLRKSTAQLLLFSCGFSNHDEAKRLILDNMASCSTPNFENTVLPKLADPQAASVRRVALDMAAQMISHVMSHFYGMDPDENGAVYSPERHDWHYPKWASLHRSAEKVQALIKDKDLPFRQVAQAVEELWVTEAWQDECYGRAGRPKAFDDKVLDIINRASESNYIPTSSDIRFAAYCHGGFNGDTFQVATSKFVEVVDLNNMWRRLPMHSKKRMSSVYFSDATSILIPVDLASYTHQCPASGDNNLARTIYSAHGFFQRTSFPHASIAILLWNVAAFKNKLKTWPLEKYFPDYKPNPNVDPEQAALDFIMDMVHGGGKQAEPVTTKQVYVHVGEPDERRTFDFITAYLKESLLDRQLSEMGLRRRSGQGTWYPNA